MGSVWGQWGQCGSAVGSVWGQWGQCGSAVGSVWQCTISLFIILSRWCFVVIIPVTNSRLFTTELWREDLPSKCKWNQSSKVKTLRIQNYVMSSNEISLVSCGSHSTATLTPQHCHTDPTALQHLPHSTATLTPQHCHTDPTALQHLPHSTATLTPQHCHTDPTTLPH